MRADMLTSILSELNGSSADIEASAIVSIDGLMMAALLPSSMDEDRVGAMSAALLSLGDRTAKELARGGLEQVLRLTVAQVAPILPYLFMVLILIFRPKGLLGTRET